MATTKVELYNGATLVATKTSAPFTSIDWTPATTGAATLTAKRYEDGVLVATSSVKNYTVDAAAGDTTAPTITTATVEDANPSALVVVFSEVVTITDVTGLTIAGAATPTLSAPTGSGTSTLSFTLSAPLTNGQSVTLEVAGTNNILDAASNTLVATSQAITNNVAATGGSYLLADYPTTAGGYSVHSKLDSAYVGSAFRVRRSSDNVEQDIGFSGDLIDESALTTFIGANSGYITKIYSQGGTATDLVQATTTLQPLIVSSGTIHKDGGKVSALFGANSYLSATGFGTGVARSLYMVAQRKGTGATYHNLYIFAASYTLTGSVNQLYSSNGTDKLIFSDSQTTFNYTETGTSFGLDAKILLGMNRGSGAITYRVDGTELTTKTAAATTNEGNLYVGGWNGRMANMSLSEIVVWSADKNANAAGIEANMNGRYVAY